MRYRFIYFVLMLMAFASCSSESETKPVCQEGVIPERQVETVADTTFKAGPYLSHVSETEAVVFWHTEEECNGVVKFGTSKDALTKEVALQKSGTVHSAHISGLKADTQYFYRVESCGKTSGVHFFYTAPPKGAAVKFTVWGDSRSNAEVAAQVVAAMAQFKPYFSIHTGDVVTDGKIGVLWYDEFLTPWRPLGHSIPLYIAIGNHEHNAQEFYDYFDYPQPLESEDEQFGSFYSFVYGNVFVLVIDTNKFFFSVGDADTKFSQWIKEQVASEAAQRATWRIAVGHEPGFSECWSPGACDEYDGTLAVKNWLLPLLAEHNFHVYFAGHTHAYERGFKDGVLHIISGGGGSELDQWCRDFEETEVVRIAYGFVVVNAYCSTLEIEWHEIDNPSVVVDKVVLTADSWGTIAEDYPPADAEHEASDGDAE